MTDTAGMGLTPRQRDAFNFIARYIRAHDGVAPTLDEIAAGIEIRSKSGVKRLLGGLSERGYIETLPNRARSIRIKAQTELATPTSYTLPPKVQADLARYCSEHQEDEAAVVTDAVALFLDECAADANGRPICV